MDKIDSYQSLKECEKEIEKIDKEIHNLKRRKEALVRKQKQIKEAEAKNETEKLQNQNWDSKSKFMQSDTVSEHRLIRVVFPVPSSLSLVRVLGPAFVVHVQVIRLQAPPTVDPECLPLRTRRVPNHAHWRRKISLLSAACLGLQGLDTGRQPVGGLDGGPGHGSQKTGDSGGDAQCRHEQE